MWFNNSGILRMWTGFQYTLKLPIGLSWEEPVTSGSIEVKPVIVVDHVTGYLGMELDVHVGVYLPHQKSRHFILI